MDVKKIGEAIRYLRIKKGYTQQNIADYLNISFQAVSKWERGLCIPDASYLSKLADLLNVDLDDLLDGNITYVDDEWRGVLSFKAAFDIDNVNLSKIYDVLIAYFMLAGIRQITVKTEQNIREQMQQKFQDGRQYGLQLEYSDNQSKRINEKCNTMIVSDFVFMYGTNLTKYFWRAMDRKEGVSVLTVDHSPNNKETDKMQPQLRYDKQNIINDSEGAECHMLPVAFIPREFASQYNLGISYLIETKKLYAEPMARGLISTVIQSKEDCEAVNQLSSLLESLSREKIYDLNEIAKIRLLI